MAIYRLRFSASALFGACSVLLAAIACLFAADVSQPKIWSRLLHKVFWLEQLGSGFLSTKPSFDW
jgi:hypothetical protein